MLQKITKPSLQTSNACMKQIKQCARGLITDPESWDDDLDSRNTQRLKEIITEIGWLTISKVGPEGSMQVWLLAQHADHDPEFQKECLRLMQAQPKGEVASQNIVFFEDRIAVAEGRPQPYGTQFRRNAEDQFEPLPLLDPETVDKRRLAMGLDTLAENQIKIEENYG